MEGEFCSKLTLSGVTQFTIRLTHVVTKSPCRVRLPTKCCMDATIRLRICVDVERRAHQACRFVRSRLVSPRDFSRYIHPCEG